MAMAPELLCGTRQIEFTVHTIMVSGARICEDSGSTFTLQSPGGFLILSQFKFDREAGEMIIYRCVQ